MVPRSNDRTQPEESLVVIPLMNLKWKSLNQIAHISPFTKLEEIKHLNLCQRSAQSLVKMAFNFSAPASWNYIYKCLKIQELITSN